MPCAERRVSSQVSAADRGDAFFPFSRNPASKPWDDHVAVSDICRTQRRLAVQKWYLGLGRVNQHGSTLAFVSESMVAFDPRV